MRRRSFISACSLAVAYLAGCSDSESDDNESLFLEADETPEGAGAQEFMTAVEEETDGLYQYTTDGDEHIGFRTSEDVWEIKYYGPNRKEGVAALATSFTSHRPEGVSLEATAYHECQVGSWEVDADDAAAYERGEIDQETFVERVWESVEDENTC